MQFTDFKVTENDISTEGFIKNITEKFRNRKSKATIRTAPKYTAPNDEEYDVQFTIFEKIVSDFLKDLQKHPIEGVTILVSLGNLDKYKKARLRTIPIFQAASDDITAPADTWLYDNHGLGPVELAFNAAVDRFYAIAKNYDLKFQNDVYGDDTPLGYKHVWQFVFIKQ